MARRRRTHQQSPFLWYLFLGFAFVGYLDWSHKYHMVMVSNYLILFSILSFFLLRAWIRHSRSRSYRQALRHLGVTDVDRLNPIQFEEFCAVILEDHGWKVNTTRVTGDFGVDVIAEYQGKRLAIQCKHYTGSVGVAAVQEVHSGAAYWKCDAAMVVSSHGGFTNAACDMGDRLQIPLLDARQFAEFIQSL